MQAVTNFFNGLANNLTNIASNVQNNITIAIQLDGTEHQKTLTIRKGGKDIVLPVYQDEDDISGRISIQRSIDQKYQHLGLKCFLIGFLEIYGEDTLSTQFMMTSKELEPAGFLMQDKTWRFKFSHFDKEYESFKGTAGRVRYFIRAQLNRNVIGAATEQQEFAVIKKENLSKTPIVETVLNVGVDERLHIQFRLQKNCYHLKEWVCGNVTFHTVRMPVARMEIALIRRQSLGTPDDTTSRSKVLTRFEVMDGCPDQGDTIPFRMLMSGVKNLTPSYKSIHNRLFVRHWFCVTIFDNTGHKYFKQAEITFYRK